MGQDAVKMSHEKNLRMNLGGEKVVRIAKLSLLGYVRDGTAKFKSS